MCLLEARYDVCQGFKLGSSSRNISWSPDPVLENILVVNDARLSEESFGLAAIGISHINLLLCRHDIIYIAILTLLFLFASLPSGVCIVVYIGLNIIIGLLRWPAILAMPPSTAPTLHNKGLIVLLKLLLKWLDGEVVVHWTFTHSAVLCAFINPSFSSTFLQIGSELGRLLIVISCIHADTG